MNARTSILIVDDENVVRDSLGKWFEEEGYSVDTATTARDALLKLPTQRWDVALVDIKMPGMDGLELQRKIREVDPEILVIIMTGYAAVETAVQALKDGAYDYITKPFDPDDLAHLVRKALEHRRTKEENVRLRESLATTQSVELVGKSPVMQQVEELIRTVAVTDTTVLIRGESGTGKELVAQAIHNLSPRRYMPMVVIHCGALTETLLESELFGHEKGAFTGAYERRIGRFEQAQGGTLFLDELGEIDASTQIKLLRFLGERTFERVGSNKTLTADIRLVAATNKNLEELVKAGAFREDLFFRLRVVEIWLPPLRERPEDLPLLAQAFLREFARENEKPVNNFTAEALVTLLRYAWPGNVRELRTAIEHAVVLCRGERITARDLPPSVRQGGAGPPAGAETQKMLGRGELTVKEAEKELIIRALKEADGNRSLAAKKLGMSRRTLHRKFHAYHLEGF